MSRITFYLSLVFLLLVFIAGYFSLRLDGLNYLKHEQPPTSMACLPVTGIENAVDMLAFPTRRQVLIASRTEGRVGRAGSNRGGIYAVSIDDPLAGGNWKDRSAGFSGAFQPMGLDYAEQGGKQLLYVANRAGRSVEIFEMVEGGAWQHLETLRDKRLHSPNDLVVVGPRQFYVTNSASTWRRGQLNWVEMFGPPMAGEIYYFNGVSWQQVAAGLLGSDGLLMSPDGKTLVMAETSRNQLVLFERQARTGVLRLLGSIAIPGQPQAMTMADDGSLLVAAVRRPLSLFSYFRGHSTKAPSRIYTLPEIAMDAPVSLIYANDGKQLSAAAVAGKAGRKIIIGSALEDKFLLCDGR